MTAATVSKVPLPPSRAARARLEAAEGGPFLVASWGRAVFIHYRVPAELLRAAVPFELDPWNGDGSGAHRESKASAESGGWAYLTIEAHIIDNLCMMTGGRSIGMQMAACGQAEARGIRRPGAGPAAGMLGVRTYVRHPDHTGAAGIYYLARWLSSSPVHLPLDLPAYGPPAGAGRFDFRHALERGTIEGWAANGKADSQLRYAGTLAPTTPDRCRASEPGSLDEFLLERYTVFTRQRCVDRLFRLWHDPWPQRPADIRIHERGMLDTAAPFLTRAQYFGAHVSPGLTGVWIGKPQCINGPACAHPWPDWGR